VTLHPEEHIVSTRQQQSGKVGAREQGTADSSPADQVLGRSQSSRPVIQDFVPLADSLEWELGQQYLKERGSAAFTVDSSPVPFVVNNDGALSRRAAEVFFESLADSDRRSAVGNQEDRGSDDIYVLELGVGVGLFARFFLDHFRDL